MNEIEESKDIPYEMLGTPIDIWFRKLLDDYNKNEDINKSNNEEE